jgi:hypothetical protein
MKEWFILMGLIIERREDKWKIFLMLFVISISSLR